MTNSDELIFMAAVLTLAIMSGYLTAEFCVRVVKSLLKRKQGDSQ